MVWQGREVLSKAKEKDGDDVMAVVGTGALPPGINKQKVKKKKGFLPRKKPLNNMSKKSYTPKRRSTRSR